MNFKKQTLVLALAVITAALTITVSIISSHSIPNKHSSALPGDHERTIIGVWRMALTTVNCQTGDVVGTIPGLWTFHEGGTMSEYASAPGPSPATEFDSANPAGKITRSLSSSTAMTQAAYSPDHRELRLP
jgi:hypothetical protein